jgi:Xaa-Pro dipeptidase/ectoine hydrolase
MQKNPYVLSEHKIQVVHILKTYLKDENIIVYDENYIHTWPKHPYDYLVQIIKEKKWDKLSIGVEMDAHYYTAFCHEKIKQGLAKC